MTKPALLSHITFNDRDTDFAILWAGQNDEPPDSWTLATSRGGQIGLRCGSKYARLTIRVERWTEEPTLEPATWQEWDEVPLIFDPTKGPFFVGGFELFEDQTLDLAGLTRARARICASGRGTKFLSDTPTSEEWLVQLWPDHQHLDAMHCEPRRLTQIPRDLEHLVEDLQTGKATSNWRSAFLGPVFDIVHLVRWAPEQTLATTVEELSRRLSLPGSHIVGGLHAAKAEWRIQTNAEPLRIEANEPITLHMGDGPWQKYFAATQKAD